MRSTSTSRICDVLEPGPRPDPHTDPHADPRADPRHGPAMSWSQRACDVLSRQGLPGTLFEGLWAGYGNGSTCARCSEAVKPNHVEYEVRFRHGIATTSIQLHRECWEIWWRD